MSNSLYSNLYHVLRNPLDGSLDDERLELGPWILWRLWKNINEYIFKGKDFGGDITIRKAIEDAKEWNKRNVVKESEVKVPISNPISKVWKPPSNQQIKCNVDGSWNHKADGADIGWLSRYREGKMLWAQARKLQGLGSTIETEAEALRWAVTMVNLGYKKVIVESDSSTDSNDQGRRSHLAEITAHHPGYHPNFEEGHIFCDDLSFK